VKKIFDASLSQQVAEHAGPAGADRAAAALMGSRHGVQHLTPADE
jgi:hypothetical protein